MKASASHLIAAIVAALVSGHWCHAQPTRPNVQVSFPLQGYYRPGKYMPVRIVAQASGPPILLRAEGAAGVSVAGGAGPADAVVPWLTVARVRNPRWSEGAGNRDVIAPLKALEDGEALVGIAAADLTGGAAAAAPMFPGKSLIPIALDASQPLPGDAAAWEALDAIVFEAAPGIETTDALVATGVTIVVRSTQKPDDRWPWEAAGGNWILRRLVTGPAGAIEPAAYEPVHAWKPAWPAGFRRRVVLLAVVFSAVAIACSLWRTRRTALLVLAASAAFAGGVVVWGIRRQGMQQAVGAVIVRDGRITQIDVWEYTQTVRSHRPVHDWVSGSRPVFASTRHVETTRLILECTSAGKPIAFRWDNRPGSTMAFVARSMRPESMGLQAQPAAQHSPLRDLVRSSYLSGRDAIDGEVVIGMPELPADSALWPSVLVRRAAR